MSQSGLTLSPLPATSGRPRRRPGSRGRAGGGPRRTWRGSRARACPAASRARRRQGRGSPRRPAPPTGTSSRETPSRRWCCRVLVGEEGEARARLLEADPEERREDEEHDDGADALRLHGRRRRRCFKQPDEEGRRWPAGSPSRARARRRRGTGPPGHGTAATIAHRTARVLRGRPASSPAPPSRCQPSTYCTRPSVMPKAGGAEAPVPADLLAEVAADEGADEGAEVDPHVEDGEAGVAPRVARAVELAHDRADVGFSRPVPRTISTRPAKKSGACRAEESSSGRRAMRMPPTSTARRRPSRRSAIQPPGMVVK